MTRALVLLACLVAVPAAAQGAFSHPLGLDGEPVVPELTGRVVDEASLLSPSAEAALTVRLEAFEDSTSNQVAVLTIPSLQGEVLEEVATRVFRAWGLGQADRDNGVLLLISRDDRALRIEVGYGLEGDLTDARSSEIIRNVIVPHFRDGDFEAGIVAGTEAILASVSGTYTEPAPDEAPAVVMWIFGFAFVGGPLAMLGGFLRTGFAGAWGTVAAGLLGAFLGLFLGAGLAFLTDWPPAFLVVLLVPLVMMGMDVFLERHPAYGPARRERRRKREIIRAAQRRGATSVMIDGVRHSVPSSSGSSGGGSSFSGGGGSSGGGGASGGW